MEAYIKDINLNKKYSRIVFRDNRITIEPRKMYFSNKKNGASLEDKLKREINKYNPVGDFYGEFLLKQKKNIPGRYDLYYFVLRQSNKKVICEEIVDPERFCVYKIKDKYILVDALRTLRSSV
jgi:hypothetical protein